MTTPLPVYTNPCLVASRVPTTFYLAGISDQSSGRLLTHSIDLSNINSPIITPLVSVQHARWNSAAPKYCSPFLGDQASNLNSPFHFQQFSNNGPYDTNIFPNSTVELPSAFENMAFVSAKNYVIVGAGGHLSFALAFASRPVSSYWVGVLLDATSSESSSVGSDIGNDPSGSPMLSIGTYTPGATTPTSGHAIVFEPDGKGFIFAATGIDSSLIANSTEVLRLAAPQPVHRNENNISSKAFAVNIGESAYIFDQALDGSLVLYTINPSVSPVLQVVPMTGTIPSFAQFMTAAASNSQIALYSVENGSSRISMFDVASRAWSGSTPVVSGNATFPPQTTNGGPPSSSSSSLGVIIGTAAAGLVVLALVAFVLVRRRRRGYKKADIVEAAPQTIVYHDHEIPNIAENYVVQQPELHQHQVSYTLPQDVYVMPSPQMPQQQYSTTPIDPNMAYTSNFQAPTGNDHAMYQVQPVVGMSADPYLQPYTYAPPTIVPTHPSPTIFQAQVAQMHNETLLGGSALTVHDTAPKAHGSPQATLASMAGSPESSRSTPRNPQMNE
ncbi:hypothetical protein BGZ95_000874 [Linnemannia exigua]|uniref:Uncharacterized protein n=1 Tax=Linnemannia exigua TaxID=604196 RepID=A0AAD4D9F3_9FUNG|nr:hypothetical protein BGZ95_000874 [Linnemannia exigua]